MTSLTTPGRDAAAAWGALHPHARAAAWAAARRGTATPGTDVGVVAAGYGRTVAQVLDSGLLAIEAAQLDAPVPAAAHTGRAGPYQSGYTVPYSARAGFYEGYAAPVGVPAPNAPIDIG